MIKKSEIIKIAQENNVRTSTIDKDWILGHFIDAIYSIPECRQNLIFKGGTCLKKCRFPGYRFSEDLDFTAVSADFVLDTPLLQQIVALVESRTGTPLHIHSLDELRFQDKPTGYAAHIKFWGAEHGQNQQPPEPLRWLTSIKIEVILYETMVFEPERKNVFHPYSDGLTANASDIPIYDIHEVLAEKIRALIQRAYSAPRDYYDIWYLHKNINDIDWKVVVDAFYRKAAFKGIHFTHISQLINSANDKILQAAWENSLKYQISSNQLPAYKDVRNDLLALFDRIFSC